jgi:transposase
LTNFYFEGRKDGSRKAKFGRSKEKRSDCKLLVLALCINPEGFIRYSSILAGNTSDPDSLPDMVDTLAAKTRVPADPEQKVLVCLDAGIAPEDNLTKIKDRGYDYLCVSRTRLTDYDLAEDTKTVKVLDTKKQEISLTRVRHEEGGDYYLEISSPAKALKETSMNRLFKERFEAEMTKARDALAKKGGKKAYEKVIERVGRAIQKYPSLSKYYAIDYVRDGDNPKNMADIRWRIAIPENVDRQSGIYFLRTNRDKLDEKATWDYYNLIREIECTNRQLKTDLQLRPIHHQKDDCSDAHLFLGLLAYWIVNTIRYKLKQTGETCYWTEIKRRMSTQKAITTEATNALGEKVKLRLCSNPTKAAEDIYERLRYKKMPFRRKTKVCSTQ